MDYKINQERDFLALKLEKGITLNHKEISFAVELGLLNIAG